MHSSYEEMIHCNDDTIGYLDSVTLEIIETWECGRFNQCLRCISITICGHLVKLADCEINGDICCMEVHGLFFMFLKWWAYYIFPNFLFRKTFIGNRRIAFHCVLSKWNIILENGERRKKKTRCLLTDVKQLPFSNDTISKFPLDSLFSCLSLLILFTVERKSCAFVHA